MFAISEQGFSHKTAVRYGKLFKLWRKVKEQKQGGQGSNNLTRMPVFGVKASWKSFVEYAKAEEERIFMEIRKRKSGPNVHAR